MTKYFAISYDGKKDIYNDTIETPESLAEYYCENTHAACFEWENEGEKNEKMVLIEPMTDGDWLEMVDGNVISKSEAIKRIATEGWTDCDIGLSEEIDAAKFKAMSPLQRDQYYANGSQFRG